MAPCPPQSPRVAVVLPVFNGAEVITRAVESVLAQTFDDFELVVVDDGSTDSTPEHLARIDDPRVRVLRNSVNAGIVVSLNRGVASTSAPLIARLDADDVCAPQRLARQVGAFDRRPGLGLLASATTKVDPRGAVSRGQPPCDHAAIHFRLHFGNCLSHPTVMFRREVFEAVGGYREEWFPVEDYDLWLRMAAVTEVGAIGEPLVTQVDTAWGISATRSAEQRARVVDRSDQAIAATLGRSVPRAVLERLVWPAPGRCGDLGPSERLVLGIAAAVRADCRMRGIPASGLDAQVTAVLRPSSYRRPDGRRCWAALGAFAVRHPRVVAATLARNWVRRRRRV